MLLSYYIKLIRLEMFQLYKKLKWFVIGTEGVVGNMWSYVSQNLNGKISANDLYKKYKIFLMSQTMSCSIFFYIAFMMYMQYLNTYVVKYMYKKSWSYWFGTAGGV